MTIDTSAGIVVRKRVYFDALDAFGMLHHARYALLFDNTVLDFWHDAGWVPDPSVSVQVIRELTLTYHSPVLGVGDVDVRLWIERAGRTSVTYRFEVLSLDRAVRHAEGRRVDVNLHPKTLRPSRLPDDMWEMAAPLLDDNVARTA
jgi:acyl-CoA thioester hydrolase